MNWRLRCSVALLVCGLFPSYPLAEEKGHTITGDVVAFNYWQSLLPCYHVCGGSLLLRVPATGDRPTHIVRIDFRYPDGRFPSQLVAASMTLRFRVTRDTSLDAVLEQFAKGKDSETGRPADVKLPIWRTVPGAESVQLPFGTMVEGYLFEGDVSEITRHVVRPLSRRTGGSPAKNAELPVAAERAQR